MQCLRNYCSGDFFALEMNESTVVNPYHVLLFWEKWMSSPCSCRRWTFFTQSCTSQSLWVMKAHSALLQFLPHSSFSMRLRASWLSELALVLCSAICAHQDNVLACLLFWELRLSSYFWVFVPGTFIELLFVLYKFSLNFKFFSCLANSLLILNS